MGWGSAGPADTFLPSRHVTTATRRRVRPWNESKKVSLRPCAAVPLRAGHSQRHGKQLRKNECGLFLRADPEASLASIQFPVDRSREAAAANHAEDVDVAQVAGEHDRVFTYPLSGHYLHLDSISPSLALSSILSPSPTDRPSDRPTRFLLPVGNIHKLLQPRRRARASGVRGVVRLAVCCGGRVQT